MPELGGRMMSLRSIDGSNLLWNASAADTRGRGYINYGGDKTFVGPHSAWGTVSKSIWPPKPGWDPLPFDAVVQGDCLVCTSPAWADFGIVVRREFSIDRAGVLTVTNRLTKVTGDPQPVSAWEVAQINPPRSITLPRCTFKPELGFITLSKPPLPGQIVPTGVDRVQVSPTFEKSFKIGVHASVPWLIARIDQQLLTMYTPDRVSPFESPEAEAPIELYVNAAPSAYVELEILSTPTPLKPCETATLTTRFRIENAKPD